MPLAPLEACSLFCNILLLALLQISLAHFLTVLWFTREKVWVSLKREPLGFFLFRKVQLQRAKVDLCRSHGKIILGAEPEHWRAFLPYHLLCPSLVQPSKLMGIWIPEEILITLEKLWMKTIRNTGCEKHGFWNTERERFVGYEERRRAMRESSHNICKSFNCRCFYWFWLA